MKTLAPVSTNVARRKSAAVVEATHRLAGAVVSQHLAQRTGARWLHESPCMAAQRVQLEAAFGPAAQREAVPQEEELQVAYRNRLRPADLLALQRAVGNRDVQRMLAKQVDNVDEGLEQEADAMGVKAASTSPDTNALIWEGAPDAPSALQLTQAQVSVVQLIRHRPDNGSIIEYEGLKWTVSKSLENNPIVTITSIEGKKRAATMNWQEADFWNTTPGKQGAGGKESDFDRRKKDPTHTELPPATVLAEFAEAKERALIQIKGYLRERVKNPAGNRLSIDAIALANFNPTAFDADPRIPVPPNDACAWSFDWQEKNGRIWSLSMDSDNPLEDSSQEPHVGFTVESGPYKTFSGERRIGHIWLNEVPVWRK